MLNHWHAAISCLFFAFASVSSPALADGARKGDEATVNTGEQIKQAHRAQRAGRWEEAAEVYRAVWERTGRPEMVGELGICEVALGRYRDAAEHLQIALEQQDLLSREQYARFDEARAVAEKQVTVVAISANPQEAEVLVDDRSLGPPSPTYLVFLEPGSHTIRATLAGHDDAIATLDAEQNTMPSVSLRLRERRPVEVPVPVPVPAPVPPAPIVACPPGEENCNGELADTLRNVGYAATGVGVTLGVGLAIGAAAVHDHLGSMANSRGPSGCWGKARMDVCTDIAVLNGTRDLLATGAAVSLITAGAIGLFTLSSHWWAPGPRENGSIHVLPGVAHDEVSLTVLSLW
ncbi:MAG: PEGA domain-containing protein [Polyangiaceae bacterium]|nr:PEGA domain-containing protein [Polyangiaceae bacterium]